MKINILFDADIRGQYLESTFLNFVRENSKFLEVLSEQHKKDLFCEDSGTSELFMDVLDELAEPFLIGEKEYKIEQSESGDILILENEGMDLQDYIQQWGDNLIGSLCFGDIGEAFTYYENDLIDWLLDSDTDLNAEQINLAFERVNDWFNDSFLTFEDKIVPAVEDDKFAILANFGEIEEESEYLQKVLNFDALEDVYFSDNGYGYINIDYATIEINRLEILNAINEFFGSNLEGFKTL